MSRDEDVQPIALADGRSRAVIENIQPAVDGGRFAVKRVVGDEVVIEADCFADGHDMVACRLQWRRAGEPAWRSAAMQPLVNDRWRASFVVDSLGSWEYTVCAWVDPFQSWQHDFARRVDADDLRVAAVTGAALIEQAAQRAARHADAELLRAWSRELAQAAGDAALSTEALARIGSDSPRAAVANRYPDLRHAFTHPQVFPLTVERERARFSAWYEFFPRSASPDATRHGSFADCEAWLPYVKRMGFDVLYFPPIHPIGRARRKGRNNTLNAQPDDLGSPWAVGAAQGGHDAILGELGTLADFRRLVQRAAELDIDIALDIAFQCAPDHPWVAEHPQWFRKRSDGSIQYAENPPKKYQDIYPFDFESDDWRAMWEALAGVFEHWVAQGVRVFRVDNPHTKAYAFWEWVIVRVRALQPEVVFLSEAFTRPRVMHRLAKLGFSQSYTYFTWRNTKRELTTYFTELAQGPGREYFRPNAWPNTPDILPAALQYGGRPVFMARVTMAATLCANYGIYGPAYELLENRALRAGGEEYLDSEKFERRVWDRAREDSLAEFIAVLNRARRANPALQSDAGLRFLAIDNEQLLAYTKTSADGGNTVVCIVNLDPHHTQSGWVEIDLATFGMQPGQAYQLHDLISDAHYLWQDARNYVSLDPQRTPVHVMELRTRMKREHDFDYFL
ncbi:MAG: alpha-1,4-glucan--maltose-1-phosphate maltosyltransferase [Burkholderiaceae bacterium]|nr:alpha-1,4-glucan--maltose-1-phosphate maltosyltransferase [Burkholderiaceae bacterium]